MTNQPEPVRVALVGLMGAGKSRLGEALARSLAWPFRDADSLVEREAGLSVSEIFRTRGEEAFRDLESAVLRSLAAEGPPLVAAMGGGVVEREENRRLLAAAFYVVWIRVDPREAARRLSGRTGRPLLEGENPLEVLEGLAARRAPFYYRLADLELVSSSASTPDGLVGQVIPRLPGSGAVDDGKPL